MCAAGLRMPPPSRSSVCNVGYWWLVCSALAAANLGFCISASQPQKASISTGQLIKLHRVFHVESSSGAVRQQHKSISTHRPPLQISLNPTTKPAKGYLRDQGSAAIKFGLNYISGYTKTPANQPTNPRLLSIPEEECVFNRASGDS